MPGTLYVVATPIGNLEDLTYRAARVLREADLIAAEDTRQTRKLLTHLGIGKGSGVRLLAYHEHNAARQTPRVLEALQTGDVALVSDAGVPLVSDPGAMLVREAAEQGHRIVPIPGPSAVTAALAAAGMPADAFSFHGFLPRSGKARRAALAALEGRTETLVLFEAPHRLKTTLADLRATLGDEREVVVCRELTKLHEEVFHGTLTDAEAHFTEPRGEFVLVIAGVPVRHSSESRNPEAADSSRTSAAEDLRRLKSEGLPRREALAQVMEAHGVSRREAYRLWLEA